jgi:acyl-coenzyme A thioesterase PaaI-like protein
VVFQDARTETRNVSARTVSEGKQIMVAESRIYDLLEDRETHAATALITLMAVPGV